MMQERVYYHTPQEFSHGYFTNALVSNSFINVFESNNDFDDHSKEDLFIDQVLSFFLG